MENRAIATALLVLLSPAVFLSAQSIMPDLGGVALALCGLLFISRGSRRPFHYLPLAVGVVFLISAWLMVYQMLLASILSPLFCEKSSRRKNLCALPGIVSVSCFALWNVWFVFREGVPQYLLSLHSATVSQSSIIENVVSLLCGIGGTLVLPLLPIIFVMVRYNVRLTLAGLSLTLPFYLAGRHYISGFVPHLTLVVMLSCGVLACFSMLFLLARDVTRKKSDNHSGLPHYHGPFTAWIVVFLAVNIFVVNFGAIRYTLPLVPFLVIVLVILLKKFVTTPAYRITILSLSLGLSLCFSLVLSAADKDFANCYRQVFENSVITRLIEQQDRIYLVGKFGFQYYGERKGFPLYIQGETNLEAGDFVFEALHCGNPAEKLLSRDEWTGLHRVATLTCPSNIPIRLVHYFDHAGFYCSLVGILPYVYSSAPAELFTLYSVSSITPATSLSSSTLTESSD